MGFAPFGPTVGTISPAGAAATYGWESEGLSMPTGGVAETVPRDLCGNGGTALANGVITFNNIGLIRGQVTSNVTVATDTTGAVTVTHGWLILTDTNYNVLAVTADTPAGWAATTAYTLPWSAPYTVPTTGLYFVGIMIAATTPPNMIGGPQVRNPLYSIGPVIMGQGSGTGLTTPPAVGSAVGGISGAGSGNRNFYACLT